MNAKLLGEITNYEIQSAFLGHFILPFGDNAKTFQKRVFINVKSVFTFMIVIQWNAKNFESIYSLAIFHKYRFWPFVSKPAHELFLVNAAEFVKKKVQ